MFQFVAMLHSFPALADAISHFMNLRARVLSKLVQRSYLPLLLGTMVLAGAPATQALELVQGGYVGGETTEASQATPAGEGGTPGISLDFNAPRHGGGANAAEAPSLQFDLKVRDGSDGGLNLLGLGPNGTPAHVGGRGDGRGMVVGGALRWAGWSLGGGLGRAEFMGRDVDLFSALLGYGRLSAELSLGQSAEYQNGRNDVMMLSTDLAAWSWLTLESDLALGSAGATSERQENAVAAGRVGLRLNF